MTVRNCIISSARLKWVQAFFNHHLLTLMDFRPRINIFIPVALRQRPEPPLLSPLDQGSGAYIPSSS